VTTSVPAAKIRTGSHDLPVSPALDAFMTQGWAEPSADPVPAHPAAPYAVVRRAALSARFPADRLVVPAGVLKARSNDTDYRFRPHSAFVHLVAAQEPEWCLVLEPTAGGPGAHEATLYVRDNPPRSEGAFFRDRRYGELWVGPSMTMAAAAAAYGLACRPLDDLPAALAVPRPRHRAGVGAVRASPGQGRLGGRGDRRGRRRDRPWLRGRRPGSALGGRRGPRRAVGRGRLRAARADRGQRPGVRHHRRGRGARLHAALDPQRRPAAYR
jgi:Aminopeptidase P, N-terminal domain